MKPVDALYGALSAVLSLAVPKDPRLFVFAGRQFGGNTRPLFEACAEHGVSGVWLTTRPDVLSLGRADVVSARSLRGVWLGARAGLVVMTHALSDLSPVFVLSRRTRVVNVWHGMPIKKISRADPGFATRSYARGNLREMRRFEFMIATSEAMAELFAETFQLPRDRVHVTGQPRTDVLFEPMKHAIDSMYEPALPPHDRKVLYCPTWRDGIATRLFPFDDFDSQALESFLERERAVLLVRTHPNDPARLEARRGRVLPMQGDVVREVTDVLPQIDVLVTDYSSIYYDFLMLDRPTVFLPYDLDEYRRSPGFFLDFDSIVSGPCPATAADFMTALESALRHPEHTQGERARVRALVHTHTDGGATRRVFDRLTAGIP